MRRGGGHRGSFRASSSFKMPNIPRSAGYRRSFGHYGSRRRLQSRGYGAVMYPTTSTIAIIAIILLVFNPSLFFVILIAGVIFGYYAQNKGSPTYQSRRSTPPAPLSSTYSNKVVHKPKTETNYTRPSPKYCKGCNSPVTVADQFCAECGLKQD